MVKRFVKKTKATVAKQTAILLSNKEIKKVLESKPVTEMLLISKNHKKKLGLTFWIPSVGAPICVVFIVSTYALKKIAKFIHKNKN